MNENRTDKVWDAIVVGAGPAGSSAAIELARRGVETLLVDGKSFPRRKPCGGCLNRVSLAMLQELIPENRPLPKGVGLDGFELLNRGRSFRFEMPAGLAVDRAELDWQLVQCAQAEGVEFSAPLSLTLTEHDGSRDWRELREVGGDRLLRARVVILATGLGNRSAGTETQLVQRVASNSRVGVETVRRSFPSRFGRGRIHMAVGREGYVGLTRIGLQTDASTDTPTGEERLHVAAAVESRALKKFGPAALVNRILEQSGAPKLSVDGQADEDDELWKGTPALTASAQSVAAPRVFLVGDAAGYVEPFTGEGIRWALQSGMGVAPLAARATKRWTQQCIHEWETWYHLHIRSDQKLCQQIASTLKSPWMCWMAHQALTLRPQLAEHVISQLNNE